jgi:uncharacterized protein
MKDAPELPVHSKVYSDLWDQGYARLGKLLAEDDCNALRSLYSRDALFRSTIDMARYRFGSGEYRYFRYPLPEQIHSLRERYYAFLAPMARDWMDALRAPRAYPATLNVFLRSCHAQGQRRPTPLLLRYKAGDFNCLHQDVYGAIVFPFQVIVGLSSPGSEHQGGELLLVEQRPRAQSVGHALRLEQGEGVVITTRYRPVRGTKGYFRTNVRHGVSRIEGGERITLGIIFHDAS